MWNTAIELAYLNGIEMKNDISLFYHYLFLNRLNRCRKNAIIKMPWFFFYHSLHTHAVEKFKIPLIYRKKIELHFNWSQRQWFEKTCPPPGILWTNIPVINRTVQESGEEEIQVLGWVGRVRYLTGSTQCLSFFEVLKPHLKTKA